MTVVSTSGESRLPEVSQELVNHLRSRREWQDRLPEYGWSERDTARAIGANDVISYLQSIADGED